MLFTQVDLFVNYDCDLQAANLFERTLRGLARIVRGGESAPGMLHAMGPVVNVNAAARPKPHQLAADVALWVIKALDTWAEPLKVCTRSQILPIFCLKVIFELTQRGIYALGQSVQVSCV